MKLLTPSDKLQALHETIGLQQDVKLMQDIKAGQADIATKNFTSHEDMKKQFQVNSAPSD